MSDTVWWWRCQSRTGKCTHGIMVYSMCGDMTMLHVSAVWSIQHGRPLEAALSLYLWEQSLWYGHLWQESCSIHWLLYPRWLHPWHMGKSTTGAQHCASLYCVMVTITQVNGMDILAVREATKWCADYIRAGKVGEIRVCVCVCGEWFTALL